MCICGNGVNPLGTSSRRAAPKVEDLWDKVGIARVLS